MPMPGESSFDPSSHLPTEVLPPTHYRHQQPEAQPLPSIEQVAGDDKLFVGQVRFKKLGGVLLVVKTPTSVSGTWVNAPA